MLSNPIDHLPKSLRDSDCRRRDEAIERRKTLFRQARNISAGLRTVTDRQPNGQLTRADGAILAQMVLQNLRACVRKELHYRPTRAMLAKRTGYSQRTVSASLTRLKAAGLVVAARYAKGGRLGDKGKGLSTEWRSGCLQFTCDQLAGLGYRLPKPLAGDLMDLARWAAAQTGQSVEQKSDRKAASNLSSEPTGKKVPGTIMLTHRASLHRQPEAPVAGVSGSVANGGDLGPDVAQVANGRACPVRDAPVGSVPPYVPRSALSQALLAQAKRSVSANLAVTAELVPIPPNETWGGMQKFGRSILPDPHPPIICTEIKIQTRVGVLWCDCQFDMDGVLKYPIGEGHACQALHWLPVWTVTQDADRKGKAQARSERNARKTLRLHSKTIELARGPNQTRCTHATAC